MTSFRGLLRVILVIYPPGSHWISPPTCNPRMKCLLCWSLILAWYMSGHTWHWYVVLKNHLRNY